MRALVDKPPPGPSDTELLDVLEELHQRSGKTFAVCRESTTGHGFQVHSADNDELDALIRSCDCNYSTTVRRAIYFYAVLGGVNPEWLLSAE